MFDISLILQLQFENSCNYIKIRVCVFIDINQIKITIIAN